MVVVAIRRELAIVWILFRFVLRIAGHEKLSVLADSIAFVNKLKSPHNKLILNQLPVHRIRLETSPLIGGPAWLPLHVKVVLKNRELFHQWDLIPIDATNATTLQKLISLQPVPAQIRYRLYATSQKSIDQVSSQQELLGTKIYDADTLPKMSGNTNMTIDNAIVPTEKYFVLNLDEDCVGQEQLYIEQAHRFCQSYLVRTNMKLHLIRNNCWTFAFQLVYNVLLTSHQDTKD